MPAASGTERFFGRSSLARTVAWFQSLAARLSPAARLRIFLYLILAFQCAKVTRLVPFQNLVDGNALTEFQYAQIYTDVLNDRRLSAKGEGATGYDPLLAAGIAVGIGPVQESHAAVLFDRALRRWADPALTIKLFVWIALLMGPLLIFGAARMFALDVPSTLIVTALACAGTVGHGFLSRALILRGNIGFWLAGPLSIFTAAGLYAGACQSSRLGRLAAIAGLPLVLLLDPGAFLVLLVPVAVLIGAVSSAQRRVAVGLALVGLLVALAVNAFWLRPWLAFHSIFKTSMVWPTFGLYGFFISLSMAASSPLSSAWGACRVLIFMLAVYRLKSMRRTHHVLATVLIVWAIVLGMLGFFGGDVVPLHEIEPGHLPYLLFLVLSFPASLFMAEELLKPNSVRIVLFVWVLWLMVTWQARNWIDCYPVRFWDNSVEVSVMNDVRNSSRDRRVLLEYSPVLNDMVRIAADSPYHSFIGIPTTWWRTSLADGSRFAGTPTGIEMFTTPLDAYDDESLRKALGRYNVGSIVVTSTAARQFFEGFPDVVTPRSLVDTDPSRDHWTFDVLDPGNGFVLSGRAKVLATHDRIEVLPAGSGRLLLGFHWIKGLRVTPPLSIRPRFFGNDPVPFIEIDNPDGKKPFIVDYGTR